MNLASTPVSPLEEFKRRSRVYRRLEGLNYLGLSVWQFSLALFLIDGLGLNALDVGLVLAASYIFQVLFEVFSGAFSDIRGHDKAVFLSTLAYCGYASAYIGIFWFSDSLPSLALWACAAELFMAAAEALQSGSLETWASAPLRAENGETELSPAVTASQYKDQQAGAKRHLAVGLLCGGVVGFAILSLWADEDWLWILPWGLALVIYVFNAWLAWREVLTPRPAEKAKGRESVLQRIKNFLLEYNLGLRRIIKTSIHYALESTRTTSNGFSNSGGNGQTYVRYLVLNSMAWFAILTTGVFWSLTATEFLTLTTTMPRWGIFAVLALIWGIVSTAMNQGSVRFGQMGEDEFRERFLDQRSYKAYASTALAYGGLFSLMFTMLRPDLFLELLNRIAPGILSLGPNADQWVWVRMSFLIAALAIAKWIEGIWRPAMSTQLELILPNNRTRATLRSVESWVRYLVCGMLFLLIGFAGKKDIAFVWLFAALMMLLVGCGIPLFKAAMEIFLGGASHNHRTSMIGSLATHWKAALSTAAVAAASIACFQFLVISDFRIQLTEGERSAETEIDRDGYSGDREQQMVVIGSGRYPTREDGASAADPYMPNVSLIAPEPWARLRWRESFRSEIAKGSADRDEIVNATWDADDSSPSVRYSLSTQLPVKFELTGHVGKAKPETVRIRSNGILETLPLEPIGRGDMFLLIGLPIAGGTFGLYAFLVFVASLRRELVMSGRLLRLQEIARTDRLAVVADAKPNEAVEGVLSELESGVDTTFLAMLRDMQVVGIWVGIRQSASTDSSTRRYTQLGSRFVKDSPLAGQLSVRGLELADGSASADETLVRIRRELIVQPTGLDSPDSPAAYALSIGLRVGERIGDDQGSREIGVVAFFLDGDYGVTDHERQFLYAVAQELRHTVARTYLRAHVIRHREPGKVGGRRVQVRDALRAAAGRPDAARQDFWGDDLASQLRSLELLERLNVEIERSRYGDAISFAEWFNSKDLEDFCRFCAACAISRVVSMDGSNLPDPSRRKLVEIRREGATIPRLGVTKFPLLLVWLSFTNLIENALTHGVKDKALLESSEPVVTVGVTAERRGVSFCFRDPGGGIPLNEWQRAIGRARRPSENTGWGLRIVVESAYLAGLRLEYETIAENRVFPRLVFCTVGDDRES